MKTNGQVLAGGEWFFGGGGYWAIESVVKLNNHKLLSKFKP